MLIRVSCPRCHITVWTDDPEFARSADFHIKKCGSAPKRQAAARKPRAKFVDQQSAPLALAAAR
jgi:hypothetical protein